MNRQQRIVLVGLIGLAFGLPAMAEVYMERDAEGNVVFTDRPSTSQARPIELSPPSTYQAPAMPAARSGGGDRGDPDRGGEGQGYEFITIGSPLNDSPVRENSGTLDVIIDLSPGLKSNHHLLLLMDGMPVAESQSMTLRVQNVDRGTHTIQVQVVDEAGRVIIGSDSVTFHMLRV